MFCSVTAMLIIAAVIYLIMAGCSSAPASAASEFDFDCHPVRITDTTDTRCESVEAVCFIKRDGAMSCLRKE